MLFPGGNLSALELWNCTDAPARSPRGLGEGRREGEREGGGQWLSGLLDTPGFNSCGVCGVESLPVGCFAGALGT